jgi:hypothetical protein
MTPLVLFPLGLFTIVACLGAIIWLARHGPTLVPGQDTRITSIIISTGSRLVSIFITVALVRSAWGAYLPSVLSGEPFPTRALVSVCRGFMSLGQLENFTSLPASFKIHLFLAIFVSLVMTATSASFRYDSFGEVDLNYASVPDVAKICNGTNINETTSYNCGSTYGNVNASTPWNNLAEIYNGGRNTVSRYGVIGDKTLGANVTLAVLPAGWTLNSGNLPWMAIGITCHDLPISATFSGQGASAIATIFVNHTNIGDLDVSNMPEWHAIVHLYQQYNQTNAPTSRLSPWIVVMLARDMNDGSSGLGGVAADSATYLGNSYLDLYGYGPLLQGVMGAAAWCEFNGSTGGQWPPDLFPPLNHTSNTILGTLVDDRPTMGTALLNFGPSWQYNPVSENAIPGGSIGYIANNTGPDVPFSSFFAAYIRNQWALTAYWIAPNTGKDFLITLPFIGTGPDKLFISLTKVIVLPCAALLIGFLVTLRALYFTVRQRHWVNRVEFESWWLVKALRPDIYRSEYSNCTAKEFGEASEGFEVAYRDVWTDDGGTQLTLCSLGQSGIRQRT